MMTLYRSQVASKESRPERFSLGVAECRITACLAAMLLLHYPTDARSMPVVPNIYDMTRDADLIVLGTFFSEGTAGTMMVREVLKGKSTTGKLGIHAWPAEKRCHPVYLSKDFPILDGVEALVFLRRQGDDFVPFSCIPQAAIWPRTLKEKRNYPPWHDNLLSVSEAAEIARTLLVLFGGQDTATCIRAVRAAVQSESMALRKAVVQFSYELDRELQRLKNRSGERHPEKEDLLDRFTSIQAWELRKERESLFETFLVRLTSRHGLPSIRLGYAAEHFPGRTPALNDRAWTTIVMLARPCVVEKNMNRECVEQRRQDLAREELARLRKELSSSQSKNQKVITEALVDVLERSIK